jgi:hypothetical protein
VCACVCAKLVVTMDRRATLRATLTTAAMPIGYRRPLACSARTSLRTPRGITHPPPPQPTHPPPTNQPTTAPPSPPASPPTTPIQPHNEHRCGASIRVGLIWMHAPGYRAYGLEAEAPPAHRRQLLPLLPQPSPRLPSCRFFLISECMTPTVPVQQFSLNRLATISK